MDNIYTNNDKLKLKRYKISINFHDNNDELINKYDDTITIKKLLKIANKVIDIVQFNKRATKVLHYIILQQTFNTDQIGIKIVLKKYDHDLMKYIFKYLGTSVKVSVFCYQLVSGPIHHIGPNQKLVDMYDDTLWTFNIDSFSQIYKEAGNAIHKLVNQLLQPATNLIGLGGESGYYAMANHKKFQQTNIFTNSEYIHDDCVDAGLDSTLVDYQKFNIMDHYLTPNTNLIVNISRRGLKESLAKQINMLDFQQIVYIGCDNIAITNDTNYLTNYQIYDKYKLSDSRFVIIFQKIDSSIT